LATAVCYLVFIFTLPVSLIFTLKVSKSYERFVIFRLGRYMQTTNSGYAIVLPCIDSWARVDMRMKAFSVPPQKVITVDSAVIEIGAEVFYQVFDPLKSINNIQDLNHSTRIMCQTSLLKHVGRRYLAELETSRQSIIDGLKDEVNEATRPWGVAVTKIELSAPKLYSKPNQLNENSNNPLSFLGPVLFPPGSSNPPMEQLQNYFGLGNKENAENSEKMKSINSIPTTKMDQIRNDTNFINSKIANSVGYLMSLVSAQLNSTLVREFDLLYKFAITPNDPNQDKNDSVIFFLDLKNGDGKVGIGYPYLVDPDVVLMMTQEVLQDLMEQRISPFNAYIGGQLSVSGDLRGAMKLGSLIETLK
ncbi:hypothetical protein HELRODRAFT_150560, partial [Helobdella robusta]